MEIKLDADGLGFKHRLTTYVLYCGAAGRGARRSALRAPTASPAVNAFGLQRARVLPGARCMHAYMSFAAAPDRRRSVPDQAADRAGIMAGSGWCHAMWAQALGAPPAPALFTPTQPEPSSSAPDSCCSALRPLPRGSNSRRGYPYFPARRGGRPATHPTRPPPPPAADISEFPGFLGALQHMIGGYDAGVTGERSRAMRPHRAPPGGAAPKERCN